MTSEEIKAAIGRLRSQHDDSYGYSLSDVADAFLGESHGMGVVSPSKLRYALIDLLEQAYPESYVELPRDMDGEPIRIGDEIDICECARGMTVVGVGISDADDGDMGVFVLDDDGYSWFNARLRLLRHHHEVEDVLDELISVVYKRAYEDVRTNRYSTVHTDLTPKYAEMLREVMKYDE